MNTFATRARLKGTNLYVDPATGNLASNRAKATYEAGSTMPRMVNWKGSQQGPNAELSSSLERLVSRSRYATANDGLADGVLETLVNNIVGTGIVPKFKTKDRELNKAARTLWNRWIKRSDADGKLSFYGQQALAVRSMCEGGDVFARLRARLVEDGLPVPLQIQLLEAEFCPFEKIETTATGYIQNGIEFSLIGAPRAYWFYQVHPKDQMLRAVANMAAPVPATEVVHMANIRRPGQVRGVPWLSRALVKLYELDQMDDATLVRQKISNMFAGFITPDGAFFGKLDELQDQVAPLEAGQMQVLPAGTKVEWNTPPDSGGNYESFVKHQQRNIARAANILYEQLTGDYTGINDRTWRAALNEFRMGLERWQHEIVVFQFCEPILRRWAEYAVNMLGLIKLPKGITIEDLLDVDWLPPRRPYINPVQDIQADREEVQSGFATRSQKITERGYDREDIDEENAADMDSMSSRDLVYTSDGATAVKQPPPMPGQDQMPTNP